ncbi:MerR family transcriptional regulator [Derxia gummosa]|uniref:MerR family transcriptional regulator n=1 Tax=Derxia gummosa DSM 723 TaxID=1121388 RepID=A0A8B6X745_9BURK|nr:MerR family transcriptional regulator [Derxia gummosa]
MTKPRRISDVAAASGLSAHTLRWYERIGLIDPVAQTGGARRYGDGDLVWIAFLQRLRATGMPIREMQRYAELRRQGDATLAERHALLADHLGRMRAARESLDRSIDAIEEKLHVYRQQLDRR